MVAQAPGSCELCWTRHSGLSLTRVKALNEIAMAEEKKKGHCRRHLSCWRRALCGVWGWLGAAVWEECWMERTLRRERTQEGTEGPQPSAGFQERPFKGRKARDAATQQVRASRGDLPPSAGLWRGCLKAEATQLERS